jgi:hypothetical protein
MAHDLIFGKTSRRFNRGSSVGSDPFVWSSDAAKAEFNRIRVVLDTVNDEMSSALSEKKLTPTEWQRWVDFYKSSHELVSQSTWWSVWKSDIDMARQAEQEAKKWHDLIVSRGAKPIGPESLINKPPESPWSFGFNLPTFGIVGGLVFAGGYLINSIRK